MCVCVQVNAIDSSRGCKHREQHKWRGCQYNRSEGADCEETQGSGQAEDCCSCSQEEGLEKALILQLRRQLAVFAVNLAARLSAQGLGNPQTNLSERMNKNLLCYQVLQDEKVTLH